MARFHFPAKPGKFSIRKPRISTRKLNFNSDKLLVAEKTERFLADFYNLVGDSDEEEVKFCLELKHIMGGVARRGGNCVITARYVELNTKNCINYFSSRKAIPL